MLSVLTTIKKKEKKTKISDPVVISCHIRLPMISYCPKTSFYFFLIIFKFSIFCIVKIKFFFQFLIMPFRKICINSGNSEEDIANITLN